LHFAFLLARGRRHTRITGERGNLNCQSYFKLR
jgi:hypothetical protein